MALRYPHKRAYGITPRCWLDQPLEFWEQCMVGLGDRMPAPASSAHTTGLQRRSIEILQSADDPGSREPRDFGHSDNPTPSRSPRLTCSKQALAALVPSRAVHLPPEPNRLPIDHEVRIALSAVGVNPPESICRTRWSDNTIQLYLRLSLAPR